MTRRTTTRRTKTRIAIASGKGGTGKTLLSTNLAWLLGERGIPVSYADADVEEPNGHLFLSPEIETEERAQVTLPYLKVPSCSGCGKCQEFCGFNAILATADNVIVFNELCHSCGGCMMVCPEQALAEKHREIGTLVRGGRGPVVFHSGTLDVGEARATPLQEQVLERAAEQLGEEAVLIVDSPPGTSCGAMAAVSDADLVVLVTEPTPFGLHDLSAALGMVRALGRDAVAVVNRADLGNDDVFRFLESKNVPIVARIPFDTTVAEACADGRLAVHESTALRDAVSALADRVLAGRTEGRSA